MKVSALCKRIQEAPLAFSLGQISELKHGVVRVSGLNQDARIGARVRMGPGRCQGEIVALGSEGATVLPDRGIAGLALGQRVTLHRQGHLIRPSDLWLGRIIDSEGRSMDGLPLPCGEKSVPIRSMPPVAALRGRFGPRIETGLAVFNTFLPIVQGQRIGIFAGSGVGKSMLLASLAQQVVADVIVIAMIGERGREVRQFTENTLGPGGIKKAVVVASTSDETAVRRHRAALTAMSVAEFFRDKDMHVLFVMDSVTRFAEAYREVQAGLGVGSQARGYPAETAHEIMSLCERAGPGVTGGGSITGVFSVLVAGSDMDEPVADILRGVLDGHVVLDREIAERGRFPAIDLLRSVSRSLPDAASPSENTLLTEARALLGKYDRARVMIEAGLYTRGADPELDRAVDLWPDLDAFISRSGVEDIPASFDRLSLILRRARKS